MITINDIRKRREEILDLAKKHGAQNVRLFGSVVRGENTDQSDIDFLVKMTCGASLLDRIAFSNKLEDMFHTKIDVVNEKALHYTLKKKILSQGVEL